MIILLGQGKGGVGKTTLALNLASHFAVKGNSVVLVDADKQQLSLKKLWLERILDQDAIGINLVEKHGDISKHITELSEAYDYVIVDTGGFDSKGTGRANVELRSALRVADHILIPIRPSQLDVDRLEDMENLVLEATKKFNKGLKAHIVLSAVPSGLDIRPLKEAIRFDYPVFSVMDAFTTDRQVFRDSIVDGSGVWDWDDGDYPPAHDEIELVQVFGVPDDRLGEEIFAWVKRTESGKGLTKQEKCLGIKEEEEEASACFLHK